MSGRNIKSVMGREDNKKGAPSGGVPRLRIRKKAAESGEGICPIETIVGMAQLLIK